MSDSFLSSNQKILMCPPDYFAVDYVINPWMAGNCGRTDLGVAGRQWKGLREALSKFAEIVLVEPRQGLPDMVFTANAGLVLGKKAVVSRFRAKERQGEEPFFSDCFNEHGFECASWPQEIPFEGAGDALWDRTQDLLWIGSGFRSDVKAPALLEKFFNRRVIGLKLVDPRFYHLDTCFCPLPDGYIMYYPAAFASESIDAIAAHNSPDKLIAINEDDAVNFSCNAVDLNNHIFMNSASTALQTKLKSIGFTPVITPLSEFLKAGGTAKCLTLKLVEK